MSYFFQTSLPQLRSRRPPLRRLNLFRSRRLNLFRSRRQPLRRLNSLFWSQRRLKPMLKRLNKKKVIVTSVSSQLKIRVFFDSRYYDKNQLKLVLPLV
jgi:hypothetical protein